MKKLVLLFAILTAAVVVAACAPPPELRDTTLLTNASLVDGDPCGAPCWENITPGVTGWNEALTIIEDNNRLENLTTEEVEGEDGDTILRASWNARRGPVCCQMFSDDGETVSILFLQLAPTNRVSQVFETHGEPTYAIGSEFSDNQAVLNLVYPEKQMVVYAFVEGAAEGVLSETSEVIAVLYMTEREMTLLVNSNNLHDWEGYSAYTTYAPDAESFDLTPLPQDQLDALLAEATEQVSPPSEATEPAAETTEEATETAG